MGKVQPVHLTPEPKGNVPPENRKTGGTSILKHRHPHEEGRKRQKTLQKGEEVKTNPELLGEGKRLFTSSRRPRLVKSALKETLGRWGKEAMANGLKKLLGRGTIPKKVSQAENERDKKIGTGGHSGKKGNRRTTNSLGQPSNPRPMPNASRGRGSSERTRKEK